MPVVCLNWETAHLYGETWISHHRLRHRLFVDRQGWDVPTVRDLEYDQYDTPAAQYLVWVDKKGDTRGAARLLPTARPYMLKDLWPDLVTGKPPESDTVWEMSRFGFDHELNAKTRRRAIAGILCDMQEFGLSRGIESYLVVTSKALLYRVVIKSGGAATVLEPERLVGRHPVIAGLIDVTPGILKALRRRASIAGPVSCPDVSVAA